MTTRPKSSTLPSYKYLFPSDTLGIGYLVTSAGDITARDTWAFKPGSIAPYNFFPITALAPLAFTVRGQDATAILASTGGDLILSPGIGSVSNASGNVRIQDTAGTAGWNTAHLIIGIYHLWADSTSRLRIKNSAPTSDTDGTVVGTQV